MTQTVVVSSSSTVVVLSGQLGPPGQSALNALTDVDLSNITADSLLMYDESSQKWKGSKKLENHLVNAGFF